MPGNQFANKWSCVIGAHKAINYVSQLRSNQIELLIKNVYQIYVHMGVYIVFSIFRLILLFRLNSKEKV